ncbi:hypothetical protein QBC42DRAFT_290270 [Cladorrhinum samala]|uniref:Uncharacterized protein n=1 Tax=Cladorrhinum samala TaxID=585594 RepID=A0AAV9HGF9_9PEZI|nr:hypothetical protein QBC42DRAFT_290270 [Cladorrhinum samala]
MCPLHRPLRFTQEMVDDLLGPELAAEFQDQAEFAPFPGRRPLPPGIELDRRYGIDDVPAVLSPRLPFPTIPTGPSPWESRAPSRSGILIDSLAKFHELVACNKVHTETGIWPVASPHGIRGAWYTWPQAYASPLRLKLSPADGAVLSSLPHAKRRVVDWTLFSSRQDPVTISGLGELSALYETVRRYINTGLVFGSPVVLNLSALERKHCVKLDLAMKLVNEDMWIVYAAAAEVRGGTRNDREFDEWLLVAVRLQRGWDSDEMREVLEEMLEQEDQ